MVKRVLAVALLERTRASRSSREWYFRAFDIDESTTHMIEKARQEDSGVGDLDQLGERVAAFVAERDWTRFHSAKNLSMALSVEASELLELFQWRTEAESDAPDDELRRRAAEEIADVQIYLLQIAARLDVDIGAAVVDKLAKNARKYPAS